MKLKIGNLLEGMQALNWIGTQQMSGKAAYLVIKNGKIIQPELETFNATRSALLQKYTGIINDQSFSFTAADDGQKFNEELQQVLETEIEVAIQPIPFRLVEDLNWKPNLLVPVLDWLFEQ